MTPMALSSEPADRCRAASLTMTVLAFITALALMVVGFASPASAQAVPHTNNAVVATVSSQAVAAPAGGVIEVQLRAPASCRKHACRATLSKPAVIVALLANVLARQGQRTVVICTEFASGPAVAGGDPVNGSDPSGEAVFRQCDGYVYADAAACDLRIASALDFPGLSISHIALIISAAGLGGFFGAGVGAIVGSRTGSVLGTIIGAVSGIPIGAAAGAYKAYDIGQPSQQTLYSDLVGAALIVYNDEESETPENYPGWNDFIGKYGWPAFYGTIIEANPQWRAFAFGVVQGQLHDAVLGLIAGWVEAGFDVAVQIANCRPEGYSFLPT